MFIAFHWSRAVTILKQEVYRSGIYSAIVSQFEPRRWRVSFQVNDIERDHGRYGTKKAALEDVDEWLEKSGDFKPRGQLEA